MLDIYLGYIHWAFSFQLEKFQLKVFQYVYYIIWKSHCTKTIVARLLKPTLSYPEVYSYRWVGRGRITKPTTTDRPPATNNRPLIHRQVIATGNYQGGIGGSRLVAGIEAAAATRISHKLPQASSRFLNQQPEPGSMVTEISR